MGNNLVRMRIKRILVQVWIAGKVGHGVVSANFAIGSRKNPTAAIDCCMPGSIDIRLEDIYTAK